MEANNHHPITTDLFRFVTIRTPQLISEEKKKIGFIHHPDPSKSFFLKRLDTGSIRESRKIARQLANEFNSPFATLQQVKEFAPQLYNFSSWLGRNKKVITEPEVAAKISGLGTLPEEKLIIVWDNLLYQTIKRKNATVRQACIQLIRVYHFVKSFNSSELKNIADKVIQTPKDPFPPAAEARMTLLLRRLANAKIVIPKAFSVERVSEGKKKENGSSLPDVTGHDTYYPDKDVFSSASIELKNDHLVSQAAYQSDVYRKIKHEIGLAMHMPAMADKDVDALNNAPDDVRKILSDDAKKFLHANSMKGVSLPKAEALIDKKVRERNHRMLRSVSASRDALKSNDLGAALDKLKPYDFVVSIDVQEGKTVVLMTLNTGYAGAFLVEAAYQISFGKSVAVIANVTEALETNKPRHLLLHLFPQQTIDTLHQRIFTLKGTFKLNNGDTIALEATGSLQSKVTHGTAIVVNDDDQPTPAEIDEGKLFGVNRLGIGVLRRVEQEVCCYVPGEVSRVENILAREYKERHTRSLMSTETTQEDTAETEVESQTDTSSTLRNELQTEVANVLSRDSSINTGASIGVEGKFPGGSITADGYLDFASSSSSSESDSTAQTYAQEITNSALEKVLQKTTTKRMSKVLEEYEESNRHGFDNRQGDHHVTGVYRWLDIIYTNRVINYGKRLMIEFLIPEPAKFYKVALAKNAKKEAHENTTNGQLEAPKSLSEYGIQSPSDINEDNYLELGRLYDVTLENPVTPITKNITKSFGPSDDPNGNKDPDAKESKYQFEMNFLEFGDLSMYAAEEVEVDFNFDYHYTALEPGTYFILKVYNKTFSFDKENLEKSDGTSESKSKHRRETKTISLPDVRNELSLSAEMKNVYNFSVNLVVKVRLDDQVEINWQNAVYDKLMSAYDDQLAAYEAEQAEIKEKTSKSTKESKSGAKNPAFNRSVEQRELQRVATEMLTKPFGIKMGDDFYHRGKCNVPQVDQNKKWEIYSSHVKFFEQAMEWKLMAYLFYPYYWADKCDWVELIQTQHTGDTIFEAFLQSGMARVVVPVRQGFEEAVDYYMETGDIWNGGGLVMDTDDDLYLSIDEELQEAEGFVDHSWQTRVPTTLTIVQGNSVYLDDEGLPCCNKLDHAGVDNLLKGSTAILGNGTAALVNAITGNGNS